MGHMIFARWAVVLLWGSLMATEPDQATRRWWSHVQALSGDALEGREAGSEGYRKAARYVVTQFERAGLKPAGESGYYQSVPLHAVRLRTDQSEIELARQSAVTKLQWLRQITIAARAGLPESFEAGLVFAGSEAGGEGLEGKVVVQLGGGRRGAAPTPRAGVAGTLTIDATGGPEPPRWPVSYSAVMTLADVPQRQPSSGALVFRFDPAFADVLLQGSGHTYAELTALAAEGKPLPGSRSRRRCARRSGWKARS